MYIAPQRAHLSCTAATPIMPMMSTGSGRARRMVGVLDQFRKYMRANAVWSRQAGRKRRSAAYASTPPDAGCHPDRGDSRIRPKSNWVLCHSVATVQRRTRKNGKISQPQSHTSSLSLVRQQTWEDAAGWPTFNHHPRRTGTLLAESLCCQPHTVQSDTTKQPEERETAEKRRQMRLRMRADGLPLAATEAATRLSKMWKICFPATSPVAARIRRKLSSVVSSSTLMCWAARHGYCWTDSQSHSNTRYGANWEDPWITEFVGKWTSDPRWSAHLRKKIQVLQLLAVAWSLAGLQEPGRHSLGRVPAAAGAWIQTTVNRATQSKVK